MKKTTRFKIKPDNTFHLQARDQHICITSQIKLFEAPSIWEEAFPPDSTKFMFLDDKEARTYLHKESGVRITETGFQCTGTGRNMIVDYSHSGFSETDEKPSKSPRKTKYDVAAKFDFFIRGYDDTARAEREGVFIPKGTGFRIGKHPAFDSPSNGSKKRREWPATYIYNEQIGIAISFPAKYFEEVFATIGEYALPVADVTYPFTHRCAMCKEKVLAPARNLRSPKEMHSGISALGSCKRQYYWDMRDYDISEWLCDRCYKELFGEPQSAWFYQTSLNSHPY